MSSDSSGIGAAFEERITPSYYFDLDDRDVSTVFRGVSCVWEVLIDISEKIIELVRCGPAVDLAAPSAEKWCIGDGIYIARSAVIEAGVSIQGPAYIGEHVTLRQGAYVRPNCILMTGSVLGHASEMKNSILLPHAKAPHFAYVGDSVVGSRANLGAGVKLSNLPITGGTEGNGGTVTVNIDGRLHSTGMRKLGAMVGDDVQIGCNAVTNPGVLIGMRSMVYPNVVLRRGAYPPDVVIKLRQQIETVNRR